MDDGLCKNTVIPYNLPTKVWGHMQEFLLQFRVWPIFLRIQDHLDLTLLTEPVSSVVWLIFSL